MSQQDLAAVRLTLSVLFLTFLVTASLLASILSPPRSFPIIQPNPDHHHANDPHQQGGMVDALAEMAKKSFSDSWAYYAPYYPAAHFEESGRMREGCVVSQVNILQRNGARYPTSGAMGTIIPAIAKLQAATSYNDSKLNFMNSYVYDLGEEDLVQYGADQSFSLGAETFKRYRHLIVGTDTLPFVRTSGSERVILSAQNWARGFSLAGELLYSPNVDLIIPEAYGSNNTLDTGMCPAAVNANTQVKEFVAIAARGIAARLNSCAPGANLTAQEAYAIMHMCPFDTVAKEAISPFCDLFSQEEFQMYEYAGDLQKFYHTGYGDPLGAVQGIGYINELIGRLTNSPAHHGLQTNNTLLLSSETFPLDPTIYVDFSHDNLIVAVFTAMGLFRQTGGPLDSTKITKDRTWITSKMVPFSGHMTVERLSCPAHSLHNSSRPSSRRQSERMVQEGDDIDNSDGSEERENEEYVRVFVNDARQPLNFCGGDVDEMCKLEEFVRSQEYARNDGFGDFAACAYTGGDDHEK